MLNPQFTPTRKLEGSHSRHSRSSNCPQFTPTRKLEVHSHHTALTFALPQFTPTRKLEASRATTHGQPVVPQFTPTRKLEARSLLSSASNSAPQFTPTRKLEDGAEGNVCVRCVPPIHAHAQVGSCCGLRILDGLAPPNSRPRASWKRRSDRDVPPKRTPNSRPRASWKINCWAVRKSWTSPNSRPRASWKCALSCVSICGGKPPIHAHAQVGRFVDDRQRLLGCPPIHAHAQVGRAVPQHIASQRPIGQFSRTVSDPGFSLPSKSRRFAASPVFPTSANLPAFSCPLQVRAKGVV